MLCAQAATGKRSFDIKDDDAGDIGPDDNDDTYHHDHAAADDDAD